jgi:hypothetical protein
LLKQQSAFGVPTARIAQFYGAIDTRVDRRTISLNRRQAHRRFLRLIKPRQPET